MILDLLKQELYSDAINECKKLLESDPNNASYWYYLFLAENKNYIYTDFDNISNELAFNKALDLSNRREKAAYLTEYNLYKDLSILDNFGILFRYAQLENIDKIIDLFNNSNDNPLDLPYDDLEKFYSNLDYLAIVNEGKLAIDLNLIVLNLLYVRTKDDNVLDILNQLITSSNKYETYFKGYSILDSHFELKLKLLELKDTLNSKDDDNESFIDSLFNKAKEYLQNDNISRANILLDEIISEDKTYGNAYLYKLIISLGYTSEQELYSHAATISNNYYYKAILDNCDEDFINKLKLIEEKINENIPEEYEVIEEPQPSEEPKPVEEVVNQPSDKPSTFKAYLKANSLEYIIKGLVALFAFFSIDSDEALVIGIFLSLFGAGALYLVAKRKNKDCTSYTPLLCNILFVFLADLTGPWSTIYAAVLVVDILSSVFRYFIPEKAINKIKSIKFPFSGIYCLILTILLTNIYTGMSFEETNTTLTIMLCSSIGYLAITNLFNIKTHNIFILCTLLAVPVVSIEEYYYEFILTNDMNMNMYLLFFLYSLSIYKLVTFAAKNIISNKPHTKLFNTHYAIKFIEIALHIICFIIFIDGASDGGVYTSGILSAFFILFGLTELIFLIIYKFKGVTHKFDKSMILCSFLIIVVCFSNPVPVFLPILMMLISNIASLLCIKRIDYPKKRKTLFKPIFNIVYYGIYFLLLFAYLSSEDATSLEYLILGSIPLSIIVIYNVVTAYKHENEQSSLTDFLYITSFVFLCILSPSKIYMDIVNDHALFYFGLIYLAFNGLIVSIAKLPFFTKNNSNKDLYIDEKIKVKEKIEKEKDEEIEESTTNEPNVTYNKTLNSIYVAITSLLSIISMIINTSSAFSIGLILLILYALGYIGSIFNKVDKPKILLLYTSICLLAYHFGNSLESLYVYSLIKPILTLLIIFDVAAIPFIKKSKIKKSLVKLSNIKLPFSGIYLIIQAILCFPMIFGETINFTIILIFAAFEYIITRILGKYNKHTFLLLSILFINGVSENLSVEPHILTNVTLIFTAIGLFLYGLYKIITFKFVPKPTSNSHTILKNNYVLRFIFIGLYILGLDIPTTGNMIYVYMLIFIVIIEYVFIIYYKYHTMSYRYDPSMIIFSFITSLMFESYSDVITKIIPLVLLLVFTIASAKANLKPSFNKKNYSLIRPIFNIVMIIYASYNLLEPSFGLAWFVIPLIAVIYFLFSSLKQRTFNNTDLIYIAFLLSSIIVFNVSDIGLDAFINELYIDAAIAVFAVIAILNNILRLKMSYTLNKIYKPENNQ